MRPSNINLTWNGHLKFMWAEGLERQKEWVAQGSRTVWFYVKEKVVWVEEMENAVKDLLRLSILWKRRASPESKSWKLIW